LARSRGAPSAGACPDPVLVPRLSLFGVIWEMFRVKFYFLGVYRLILYRSSGANCLIQLLDITLVLENLNFRCLNQYSID
jgi:hypothetical protein